MFALVHMSFFKAIANKAFEEVDLVFFICFLRFGFQLFLSVGFSAGHAYELESSFLQLFVVSSSHSWLKHV